MTEDHVPQLSLICPTTHGWARLNETCKSIVTDLDMEIVFVGPVNYIPKNGLPIPYRFVTTSVNLVEGCQLGMYVARGETVGLFPDDEFFSPFAWDEVYDLYKESNDYKTIACMNWWEGAPTARWGDRGNFKKFLIRFGLQLPNSCSAMSHKFFWELGGYDSRYTQRMFDMDFFMKALMNGAIVKYPDEKVGYGHIETINSLYGSPSPGDMALYENRWAFENGGIVQKIEDQSFDMKNMVYTIYEGA